MRNLLIKINQFETCILGHNLALYSVIWLAVACRYRNVNVAYFRPHQVRELYDGADINEVVRLSEQKGRKYGKYICAVLGFRD